MPSQSKIGRLPRPLQIELNRRLQRNESSTPILAWLNPLPEVQAILQTEFAGTPINKQNLSEWRATGLAKWETRQEIISEILDVDADASELDTATQGRLADRLATVLAGRYARLLNQWDGEDTEVVTKKLRVLRSFTMDVSHLRRWDHSATRVRLEEIRVKSTQEIDNEALFAKFEEWGQNIGVQDYLMAHYETPRDRENAKRALLNLPPLPEDAMEPNSPASGTRVCDPQPVASPAASDDQPPSACQPAPRTDPCPAEIPPRASSPAPRASAASSTPSPEANPTPKPLSSLANSPSTPPNQPLPVNLRQPPAPGVGTTGPLNASIPGLPPKHPQPSDRQSVPLASISVNGGEGRG